LKKDFTTFSDLSPIVVVTCFATFSVPFTIGYTTFGAAYATLSTTLSKPVRVELTYGTLSFSPVAEPALTAVTAALGGVAPFLVIKYIAINCFVFASVSGDVKTFSILPSFIAGTVVMCVCLAIETEPKVPPFEVFSSKVAPPLNIPEEIFISPIATYIKDPPFGVGILP
jgi:hypothetical protein